MKKTYFISSVLLIASLFSNAQSILSVSPSSATAGQVLGVTITGSGTHFLSGSGTTYVTFGFEQCSASAIVSVNNDVSLTAFFTVPNTTFNNLHDIEVHDFADGYIDADHIFSVTGGNNYPIVMTPNAGAPGQTLNVSITGTNTHFTQSSGTVLVDIDLSQRTCYVMSNASFATVLNDNFLTAVVTIPLGTDTGYYDVSVTGTPDYNLYGMQNLFHVTGTTGVEELENEYHLEVAPNPCSNSALIQYRLTRAEEVVIELYDPLGRKIISEHRGKQSPGQHVFKIDAVAYNLRNGIYYASFSTDHKTITRKMMVNR